MGISFGSNQIYLNGEEPIGYNPCKKLKQELEIIMEIKENKIYLLLVLLLLHQL